MTEFTRGGVVYAVYVPEPGGDPCRFYTADKDSIQVGVFNRPAGHDVPQHTHQTQDRGIGKCQEVILVRSGFLNVKVYDDSGAEMGSCTVGAGELLILLAGWHSVKALTDCSFLEVKTGPYDAAAKTYMHYREA